MESWASPLRQRILIRSLVLILRSRAASLSNFHVSVYFILRVYRNTITAQGQDYVLNVEMALTLVWHKTVLWHDPRVVVGSLSHEKNEAFYSLLAIVCVSRMYIPITRKWTVLTWQIHIDVRITNCSRLRTSISIQLATISFSFSFHPIACQRLKIMISATYVRMHMYAR